MPSRAAELVQRGVVIHAPDTVYIDPAVCAANIAEGVVIHPGCRITGKETAIGPGSTIGREGPVTLDRCQLGRDVALGGGFFSEATLLDGVTLGDGAHVRPGSLLEEHAACGHAVGLKQTILLPFAVTGSLINFCDALLSGGTSRTNHSEIGSSYVHFNYTPHQDKATPSLLGDVPRGVMLDQPPVFMGGQGGLVGPARIAFGTIVAAGTLLRRDVLQPGRLVFGEVSHGHQEVRYNPKVYGDISRILENNFIYLGNLFALLAWHRHVRALFPLVGPAAHACREGAMARVTSGIHERVKRLAQLADHLEASMASGAPIPDGGVAAPPVDLQKRFVAKWRRLQPRLVPDAFATVDALRRDRFLSRVDTHRKGSTYLETIPSLPREVKAEGTAWLQAIVDHVVSQCTV